MLSVAEESELEALLGGITEEQLRASICEDRFYEFFLEFWETIETVDLVPNWHIEYICDELQQVYEAWARGEAQDDVLINVPPGTSKSTTVVQLFPAWLWVKNPTIRMISSSYAASLSVSSAIKSRDCVSSPKFQRFWPGLIEAKDDQNGKTDYRNTRGGQRFTASTGGAVTGNHADFIFIDDPIKPSAAASDLGLAAAAKHLETLSTRKTDKLRSVTIMVMQRLNEKDPAGLWLGEGRPLRHICLPGELTLDAATGLSGGQVCPPELRQHYVDGLLDPRRLPRKALAKLKVALGSYGYAGQVQQQPAPEEGGLLKKAWFRRMTWPEFLANVPGAGAAVWQFDADTAYTEKQKNDPTAIMASTYLGQTLYVRHVAEYRLELPALKRRLIDVVKLHGYTSMSKLHIEPKASGKSVVQELRSISQLNVVEAPTPSDDKTARVNVAAPFIEAQRVVLLDGPWNDGFISQAGTFPNAAHDDMLDCLTQAIARVHKPTGSFEFSA